MTYAAAARSHAHAIERRRPPNRSPLKVWGLAVISAFVLAGCGEQPPAAAKPPFSVRVQAVKLTQISSSATLTGQIAARVQSDLGFRIQGRISTRTVEVGDRVQKDQVLATIEPNQQQSDVSSAQAAVASAEATLKQAQATFERQKTLLAQGFTTQPNYDNAKQAYDVAKAGLDGAKAGLGGLQDVLANTELRAAAPGVVTARNAEVGQVVDVAQAVFTVALDGPRDAVFEVYESLVANPVPGKGIDITLLSNPSVKAVGQVREIAPAVDPSRGTVRVKIGIERAPPEMGLGAAVSGVGTFEPRDAVVLPWTAFFMAQDAPAVWIVDARTRSASLRPVAIDTYRTGELVLKDGVKSGELVVVRGGHLLRPGEAVTALADVSAGGGARQ